MKLVFIITGLSTGGAETMLFKLLQHIDRSRFAPSVISLTTKGEIGQRIEALGIPVHALEMKPGIPSPFKFLQLVKHLRKSKPDVVHTWMYHADLIGGLAARLAGCRKVIWGIRNTDLLSNNGVSHGTALIMRICAGLSGVVPHTIVCVAHRARAVHADKGYARNKITVIGNGFDMERFKPDLNSRERIRQSLNVPAGALVVGSIGRFNEYKDHGSFILSAGDLASADDRVYFLLAGREIDSNNIILKQWIEETGYVDRFRLLGERSDVPAILAAMDVFCLHSISEGFPNVLGEAMCVGLPSVVTDVGDAALILGDAGLALPPMDPNALTRGLLNLINASSEKRVKLGNIARRRIEENWSIRSVQRQYEQLYQKVLSA